MYHPYTIPKNEVFRYNVSNGYTLIVEKIENTHRVVILNDRNNFYSQVSGGNSWYSSLQWALEIALDTLELEVI